MIDLVMAFSLIVVGVLLTATTMGVLAVSIMPGIDLWNKRFFLTVFLTIGLGVIGVVSDLFLYQRADLVQVEKLLWFLESILESIPLLAFTGYLLHFGGESWRRSSLFLLSFVLWAVFLVVLVVTQNTSSIYYVSDNSELVLGPWYPLVVMHLLTIIIVNLVGVWRRRNKLSRRYFHAFLVFLIPLFVALIVHAIIHSFLLVYVGVAISVVSMFAVVLMDQVTQYVSQQREIANQRANIMVLQMRPHFIYNTMTSIYYLCEQDPHKAQEVTLDFTTYLRKNFTAIASENTVPFVEEREHTRAYLAVEQAQFEDLLFVDYDTPHVQFRLPPLTLQPIVENCVKHGLDPDGEPLHICIRTRMTGSDSQVIVEDNGSGFEPTNDGDPHIALANIRQRLELMCGGRLVVEPREGGGTKVTVTVPA